MGTLGFVLGTAAMDHQQVLIDQLVDQIYVRFMIKLEEQFKR